MKHIRGFQNGQPPAMSLVDTQVPGLRAQIYALPSKGKFATLELHARIRLHTLLNVMQMSCSTTTLSRKDHLVGILEQFRVASST